MNTDGRIWSNEKKKKKSRAIFQAEAAEVDKAVNSSGYNSSNG